MIHRVPEGDLAGNIEMPLPQKLPLFRIRLSRAKSLSIFFSVAKVSFVYTICLSAVNRSLSDNASSPYVITYVAKLWAAVCMFCASTTQRPFYDLSHS